MADVTPQAEHSVEVAFSPSALTYTYGGDRNAVIIGEDRILQREARGRYAVYRDLERDGQVSAVLGERYGHTLEADTRILVGKRRGGFERAADRKLRDMCQYQWDSMGVEVDRDAMDVARALMPNGPDALTLGLLDAVLMGFAVAEVVWAWDGREYYAARIHVRRQDRFRFDADWRLRLIDPGGPSNGRLLPARKFIAFTYGSHVDPYGLGVGNKMFHPVKFKRLDTSFWLRMLDKYGGPTAHAKYRNPTDKNKALAAAAAVHSEGAVATPEDFDIKLLQAVTTAAQQGFDGLARFLDGEISKAGLGLPHVAPGVTAGGKDDPQQAQDQGEQAARFDARLFGALMRSTLFAWIRDFNMPPDTAVPEWIKVFRLNVRAQASVDQILANNGYRRTLESVNKVYGYGEDVYEEAEPTQAPAVPVNRPPEEEQTDREEGGRNTGNGEQA